MFEVGFFLSFFAVSSGLTFIFFLSSDLCIASGKVFVTLSTEIANFLSLSPSSKQIHIDICHNRAGSHRGNTSCLMEFLCLLAEVCIVSLSCGKLNASLTTLLV